MNSRLEPTSLFDLYEALEAAAQRECSIWCRPDGSLHTPTCNRNSRVLSKARCEKGGRP